jgi:hypothetical protein
MKQVVKENMLKNLQNIKIQRKIPEISATRNTGNRLFLDRFLKKVQHFASDQISDI